MAVPAPARSPLRGRARCAIIPDRPCHWPVAHRCAVPGRGAGAAAGGAGCDSRAAGTARGASPAARDLEPGAVRGAGRRPVVHRDHGNGLPMLTKAPGMRSGSPAWCCASPRSAGPCRTWTRTPSMTRPAPGSSSAPRWLPADDRGGRQDTAWFRRGRRSLPASAGRPRSRSWRGAGPGRRRGEDE
jgi:hypothetical protein